MNPKDSQSSESLDAVVTEWVKKAEADLALARREVAFEGARNLNAVGFHLQQAVEKLMKAVLVRRGESAPRIHDLDTLDQLLRLVGVGPCGTATDLGQLSSAAVDSRYPGNETTESDVTDMMRTAESAWAVLRPLV